MKKLLTPVAVAVSLAAGSLAAPTIASAELSAALGISNMYLWRGLNLTPDGAAVDGTLQYDTEMGLYAGLWTISEQGGHETDLYVGFGGDIGDTGFSYDISYWKYLYPEDSNSFNVMSDDLGDNDLSDLVIGLSYGGFSFGSYISAETDVDTDGSGSDDDFGDFVYYTLGYDWDAYSVMYGWWDREDDAEYSHIQLGYAYNDNLSFNVTFADDDGFGAEEDPLFQVYYGLSF